MADEELDEQQLGEPDFGEDLVEQNQRDDSSSRQKLNRQDVEKIARRIRGEKKAEQGLQKGVQSATRGLRSTGRAASQAARASGQAAAQGARAAAQAARVAAQAMAATARLAAQAVGALVSSGPVGWIILGVIILLVVVVIAVLIIFGYTYFAGGRTPNYPDTTKQADMAISAQLRLAAGDPLRIDIAKQGATLLKEQLSRNRASLAAKTDTESQKLKQKLDEAIGLLDQIIAESNKDSPNDEAIKNSIEQFYKIYHQLPGLSKNNSLAERARFYAQNHDEYVKKTVCYNPTACSGFVATVVREIADKQYDPGNAAAQYRYVREHQEKYLLIPNPQPDDLQNGDILLRTIPGKNTSGHTAIFVGNGEIAHASMGRFGNTDFDQFKKQGKLPRVTKFANNRSPQGNHYWQYAARFIL